MTAERIAKQSENLKALKKNLEEMKTLTHAAYNAAQKVVRLQKNINVQHITLDNRNLSKMYNNAERNFGAMEHGRTNAYVHRRILEIMNKSNKLQETLVKGILIENGISGLRNGV